MKSLYDKIFLVIGLLALGAGIGFYFLKSGELDSADALLNQAPSGPDYEFIEAPAYVDQTVAWPEPVAQDADGRELYDIFTPPKIYWDPIEGKFTFEPPVGVEPPPPPVPFGLELVEIDRELFRIQLEAHFQGKDDRPDLWQFYNADIGEPIRGKIGDSFQQHGFKIISGEVKRVVTETEGSTTIKRVPTVVIEDLEQDGLRFTLTTESNEYLEGELLIVMETVDPYPVTNFEWDEVGQTHQAADATFTLKEINFDNKTVTVEKASPESETPETELLSPRQIPTEVISTSDVEELDSSNSNNNTSLSQGLDSLFN